jgi:hypothetical protein
MNSAVSSSDISARATRSITSMAVAAKAAMASLTIIPGLP